jgi:hypothetical protein
LPEESVVVSQLHHLRDGKASIFAVTVRQRFQFERGSDRLFLFFWFFLNSRFGLPLGFSCRSGLCLSRLVVGRLGTRDVRQAQQNKARDDYAKE